MHAYCMHGIKRPFIPQQPALEKLLLLAPLTRLQKKVQLPAAAASGVAAPPHLALTPSLPRDPLRRLPWRSLFRPWLLLTRRRRSLCRMPPLARLRRRWPSLTLCESPLAPTRLSAAGACSYRLCACSRVARAARSQPAAVLGLPALSAALCVCLCACACACTHHVPSLPSPLRACPCAPQRGHG